MKSPELGMCHLLLSCWSMGSHRPSRKHYRLLLLLLITHRILWQQSMAENTIGQGKIKLVLTQRLHFYRPAFILESAMHATREEKQKQKSFLSVNPASYNNDCPGKRCLLLQCEYCESKQTIFDWALSLQHMMDIYFI